MPRVTAPLTGEVLIRSAETASGGLTRLLASNICLGVLVGKDKAAHKVPSKSIGFILTSTDLGKEGN